VHTETLFLGPTAKTLAQIGLLTSSRGPVCIETLEGIASLPLKEYIARFEYGELVDGYRTSQGAHYRGPQLSAASLINDLR
jgi:hypothetical protein